MSPPYSGRTFPPRTISPYGRSTSEGVLGGSYRRTGSPARHRAESLRVTPRDRGVLEIARWWREVSCNAGRSERTLVCAKSRPVPALLGRGRGRCSLREFFHGRSGRLHVEQVRRRTGRALELRPSRPPPPPPTCANTCLAPGTIATLGVGTDEREFLCGKVRGLQGTGLRTRKARRQPWRPSPA